MSRCFQLSSVAAASERCLARSVLGAGYLVAPVLVGVMLASVVGASTTDAASPSASTGLGSGMVESIQGEGGCADLFFHADGTYENGYAWQYGGIVAPYYGAFAECYAGPMLVCGAAFDLTQTGNASGRVMDVYVWDDNAGSPGAVNCVVTGVDPGTVGFWPSLSRHVVDLPNCNVGDDFWVGYWGAWPNVLSGWFVGADVDGPVASCPFTNIAPGVGYPTGWQHAEIVWGPTQSIGIGVYGGNGDAQGACCFSDGTCQVLAFQDCTGGFQGTDTVCDPNPCPQIGACCFDDGSCLQLLPADCNAAGGEWLDTLPCDPNPCEQATACCFSEDGACLVLIAEACLSQGGVPDPTEMSCDPNPCPQPFGACCYDDETCQQLEIGDCAASSGHFQGDGTLCEPNPCGVPGACCIAGSCSELAITQCLGAGGAFFGPGTTCTPGICYTLSCDGAPIPLHETGMEPDPADRHADRAAGDLGAGRGVAPTGEERDCGPLLMNADQTYENGYAWGYGGIVAPCFGSFAEQYDTQGGVVCSAVFDFTQTGTAEGAVMDVYVWEDAGGAPGAVADVVVAVDPGPIAFWPSISRHVVPITSEPIGSSFWIGYWGAWPTEPIHWFIAADLDGPGQGNALTLVAPGIGYPTGWQNVSVAWGPTQAIGIGAEVILEGAGACCFLDQTCVLSTMDACEGEFQGPGTDCEPNPCPPPPDGACCFPDGSCVYVDAFECHDLGGSYFGDGTACDPNPCPPPPLGACCFEDGTCRFEDEFVCGDLGGNYFGENTVCDPNPCPQPEFGACCAPGQGCLVLADYQCEDAGGTFLGDGTDCDGVVCGVPCIPPLADHDPPEPGRGPNAGGTLIFHSNPGVVYTADQDDYCGSMLDACENAISETPEHYETAVIHLLAAFPDQSNPRLAGVTFGIAYADCVVLQAWGNCGDFELSNAEWPASGEGTAVTWSAAQTTQLTDIYWFAAYVYSVESATLDIISHPQGGTLFADDDVPSNLDPVADFGSFGFGMDGYLPCPLGSEPGGCCFADGSCNVLSREDCAGQGGEYVGDGTVCDPNPCSQPSLGACCIEDESCVVLSETDCNATGGVYQGDGTSCDPNPCSVVPVVEESWGGIKEKFRR